MPSFVLDLENLYILLQISFEPSPYRRVITVTGYNGLLYRGAIVVVIPIAAYGEPLNEDHQDIPSDWMDADYWDSSLSTTSSHPDTKMVKKYLGIMPKKPGAGTKVPTTPKFKSNISRLV